MKNEKLISSMSEEERKEYFAKVGKAVETVKELDEKPFGEWNGEDSVKYSEVVWLLSAYSYARSFTKQDMAFKPEKRMAMVKMYLNAIVKKYGEEIPSGEAEGTEALNPAAQQQGNVAEPSGKAEGTVVEPSGKAEGTVGMEEKLMMLIRMYGDSRPKHFDEWSEFMSPGLKKKTDSIDSLYVQLGEARKVVEELSITTDTTEEERSKAAKSVAKIDNKIGSIYKLANEEWKEIVENEKIKMRN